jgi:hypothetical protein
VISRICGEIGNDHSEDIELYEYILTTTDEFIKPTILFLHMSVAINVGSTRLHIETELQQQKLERYGNKSFSNIVVFLKPSGA